MEKIFKLPLLPHWVINDLKPAFYDTESTTAIGQTARLYAKMEELVKSYNKWIDEINSLINQYDSQTNVDLNQFKTEINQICHNYIQTMDLKIAHQDREIEESITFIKDNIYISVKSIIEEMKDSGELNETILSSLEGVNENINNLESLLNNEVEKIFDLQQDNNQNKQDIASIKQDINELKEINKEKIETLEIDNSENKQKINTLETDNTENKEKIRLIESNNTENEQKIEVLEENLQNKIQNTKDIENKETNTYSAEIIDGLIGITKVSISEILTMTSGFTLLDGNIYKDRNRYFGNITVKKNSGNFIQGLESVASFNKTIVTSEINTSCILAEDQYGSVYVTQCYMGATGIKVTDWHNGSSGKYNHAKINIDLVTSD